MLQCFNGLLSFIFRLNSQGGDGSRLEQYQGSSPDRDSSTDFDDLDVDDKSFEDDDDDKIDIENEDDAVSQASPVSLSTSIASPPTPQISPTWLYGLQNRDLLSSVNPPTMVPQPWALNLTIPKVPANPLVPPPVRSFGIDDILHKPLDFSQNSLQQLQQNLRHIHHSFPYKYMNNYVANLHQSHTASSRDLAEKTEKTDSTCRDKTGSAQSGSGD